MNLQQILNRLSEIQGFGLGAPILVLMILGMMVLPLPPFLLDVLFTFNISLSLVVLLAVVYAKRPLDFAVFPTILLVTTLLRLSLNIASTRVVLLHGHQGTGAAGKVIQAFGEFVVGGNYAVGLVVFTILVIINFMVVTKGAGRVSEVSARFTLDAMPGKQMAIDADLNAGVIGQDDARKRREEIGREADFYGAMDGASKFIRGDAIAGILILIINMLGGIAIGTLQHNMGVTEALRVFALLTIGDGLVAQFPALLLATASAVMVTRATTAGDMAADMVSQVFANPQTLAVASGIIGLMGLIPGMPNLAFLTIAGAAGYAAYRQSKKKQQALAEIREPPPPPVEIKELSWDDVTPVDAVSLDVGYRLIPMVDKAQNGQLLHRLRGVRKKLSQDLGFLVPTVHIRDNLDIGPNTYQILVLGVTIASADVYPDKEMAINPGQVYGTPRGITGKDPVFGLEAIWIDNTQREEAQSYGYTVVDASTVIATHMSQILQEHAADLLGHDEVQHLLDGLARLHPKLVENLVPKAMSLGVVVKVLQNLLTEGIPIRDPRTILEVLSEQALRTQDPGALTAAVRVALGRLIVQQIVGMGKEMPVITIEPNLEQILHHTVQTMTGGSLAIEPGLAARMLKSLKNLHEQQEIRGEPAVLVVADNLRDFLSRFVRAHIREFHILAFREVPDNIGIRITGVVGGEEAVS